MKTNLFSVKHYLGTGPGGWYCICCGPAPKYRDTYARLHKRRIYRLLDKLEKDQ